MRRAITIAYKPNGKTVTLSGPEIPIQKQLEEFKKLSSADTHKEFESVEFIEVSDVRQVKFVTPEEKKKRQERFDAAVKAAEEEKAKLEAANKRNAEGRTPDEEKKHKESLQSKAKQEADAKAALK